MGLAVSPPPGAAALWGEGRGVSPGLGRGRGLAPPWAVSSILQAGGGEPGGGSSPPSSSSPAETPGEYRGLACSPPALAPPHGWQRRAAHPSLPRAWPVLFDSPRRRARSGHPLVGESGRGGGLVGAPPLVGGSAGGPRGTEGKGLLCLGLPLCPPRAGIKVGRSVVVLIPGLHRPASACRRPDAVCGVPLRAGAGLLARRGHCGSGRAADWGHAAYSSIYRGSCAPPWVPQPSQGGGGDYPLAWRGVVRGRRPPGRPLAVRGRGGERGQEEEEEEEEEDLRPSPCWPHD